MEKDLSNIVTAEDADEMAKLVVTQPRYDLSTDAMLSKGFKPVQALLYWVVAQKRTTAAARLIVRAALKRKGKGVSATPTSVAKSLEEVAAEFSELG